MGVDRPAGPGTFCPRESALAVQGSMTVPGQVCGSKTLTALHDFDLAVQGFGVLRRVSAEDGLPVQGFENQR